MPDITLITGGTGAGKTARALALADAFSSKTYVATAVVTDGEMQAKVDAHKAERDETYSTIEEPLELSEALEKCGGDVVIIDCVTFWVNNLLYHKKDETAYFAKLILVLKECGKPVILVTNEVGLGIIPWEEETRRYAKNLSKVNRQLAEIADRVEMMVSGIPLSIK